MQISKHFRAIGGRLLSALAYTGGLKLDEANKIDQAIASAVDFDRKFGPTIRNSSITGVVQHFGGRKPRIRCTRNPRFHTKRGAQHVHSGVIVDKLGNPAARSTQDQVNNKGHHVFNNKHVFGILATTYALANSRYVNPETTLV